MTQATARLTTHQEVRLRRRVELIQKLVLDGRIPYKEGMLAFRRLIAEYVPEVLAREDQRKHDSAVEHRHAFQNWYNSRNFSGETLNDYILVPLPLQSNRQILKLTEESGGIFYAPPTGPAISGDVLARFLLAGDIRIKDGPDISWETHTDGYWFALRTILGGSRDVPWVSYSRYLELYDAAEGHLQATHLPSLLEYSIMVAMRVAEGKDLDGFGSLLRTTTINGDRLIAKGFTMLHDSSSLQVPAVQVWIARNPTDRVIIRHCEEIPSVPITAA